jgi:hypothetical protein
MRRQLGWLCILPALASLTPIQNVAADVTFTSAMQAASQARSVPLPLIEATAYVNSRWQWMTAAAVDGGVGPMHVTRSQMAQAVALSGHTQAQISGDLSANLDAGAALLAKAHTSGTDLASWQPAVAATQGPYAATEIFNALRSGETATASTGEVIVLSPQSLPSSAPSAPNAPTGAAPSTVTAPPDQPGASWVPANLANFSYANRPQDYPVNMIIIHDTESSYGWAIQYFQDPAAQASAHYVVSDAGDITQMVREHDIAWHAGNWDYNTRAIGIEHEGYAYVQPTWYTAAMYNASAYLIASICSRWGVPMDRTHVIGHSEVPDPNNPGLYGGADHHTDPGPYWDWNYYMGLAQHYASGMASPPHMGPDPVAVNGATSATVTWQPAQTCTKPITGYTVTTTPATQTMTLPAGATSATFNNLTPGTSYTLTVTATNPDGSDSLTSNATIPGRCTSVQVTTAPQPSGTAVQVIGTSAGCPNPQYEFWILAPNAGDWRLAQAYSSATTFNWTTTGQAAGGYSFLVRARDTSSPGTNSDRLGTFDAYAGTGYKLGSGACASVAASGAPPTSSLSGTQVTITGTASGCPSPLYEFWMLAQGSSTWRVVQGYSASASYQWNSTGALAGTEHFGVWVRDASSSANYDAYTSIPYSVKTPSCASVTASAAPASPSAHGAGVQVTVTGVPAGCTNANPQYEFWMLAQGSSTWQLVRGYSTSASYVWNTNGAPAGMERFGVWIRDANSSAAYDAFVGLDYTLT